MITFIDECLVPSLAFLADWSFRWGVVIGVIIVVFRICSPRSAAVRHWICATALAVGLIFPLIPRWELRVPWPSWPARTESQARVSSELDGTARDQIDRLRANQHDRQSGASRIGEQRATANFGNKSTRNHANDDAIGAAADAPLGTARILVALLSLVWLAGTAFAFARFALGRVLLARLVAKAQPVGDDATRIFDDCRAEFGLNRAVRVRTHPAVRAPIALGGRRPTILVPSDWETLSAAVQRACLLHELAHIARRDDHQKLFRELIRIPFFFHPLVIWLLERLERESELLCDEAAVACGIAPHDLARILLEFARRPSGLWPAAFARPAQALPFFHRGTVQLRITRLLEDDMSHALAPFGRIQAIGLSFLVLAIAGAAGSLQVRARDVATEASRAVEARSMSPAVVVGERTPAPRSSPAPELAMGPAGRGLTFLPRLNRVQKGPDKVAPDELAGIVIDEQGKPLEGVEVDAWEWAPGNETRTNREGHFRLGKFEKGEEIQVRFRKDGFAPRRFFRQPAGEPDWVIVMDDSTYLEGVVRGPGGKPVEGALVRGDSGRKELAGGIMTECWTETKSGKDGRYRLHLEPGAYDLQVRVPGTGVTRQPASIDARETKSLDIDLKRGINFVALAVDSQTGKPLQGVALSHWQHPGVDGRSNAEGRIEIADMFPGPFSFQVKADGYARWWSNDCVSERSRFQKAFRHGFQRNFDDLDFSLESGMKAVTITLEHGVKVRGQVLDPDGKPVVGATVAPALTGSGNSLTGDTRFSIETNKDGRFETLLPASGDREYNLVAHDGKYGEWRKWANGVCPTFMTKPGDVKENVTISLTRPATITGRVLDQEGRPVAERDVRTQPVDMLENRYYDPTIRTKQDGTFELKFVRPGEQLVQCAPFWLQADEAPIGSSVKVLAESGKTIADVELIAAPAR